MKKTSFIVSGRIFLALLFMGAVLRPAAGKDVAVISYSSLTAAKMDTLIVARVGSIEITAKEFLLSYEYGPAFVKRGKNSKKRYLEFMINEKLLALDGYANGLQASKRITETLSEIEGDLATEELFKDDVMSKVKVTETEIEQAVLREKQNISLKWLFTTSTDEMKRLNGQIRGSTSFDSLFVLQLRDSVQSDDRSLETTRFKLESRNPALSKIVDTLALGKISNPISTADGWYFVKIVDSWINPITTETESNRLRNSVQRALFKHKMDVLSDQYIREMMREADPVIVRKTFDLLRAFIGEKILPPEKLSEWKLTKRILEEFGPLNVAEIEGRSGNMPLVRLKRGAIPLKQFLTWYRTRQTNIRLSTSSQKSFFISLQQLIWRVVRDHLLVQRASRRGYQYRESVKTQKQWWKAKIVQEAVKSDLILSLNRNDSLLASYYRKNIRRYRNRKGKVIPFEKAKTDVRRDYYSQELNKKLLHRILSLKQRYKVKIYENVLNNLYVDMEHDPKAIDVYVVKKGGTYPRPAFPVIDYDWKAWY